MNAARDSEPPIGRRMRALLVPADHLDGTIDAFDEFATRDAMVVLDRSPLRTAFRRRKLGRIDTEPMRGDIPRLLDRPVGLDASETAKCARRREVRIKTSLVRLRVAG